MQPLLVTGAGGTGTHLLTDALAVRGMAAAHEGVTRATVGWMFAVHDVYVGAQYPWVGGAARQLCGPAARSWIYSEL